MMSFPGAGVQAVYVTNVPVQKSLLLGLMLRNCALTLYMQHVKQRRTRVRRLFMGKGVEVVGVKIPIFNDGNFTL